MTPEQALMLKLHDIIQWDADPADLGEVIYVTNQCAAIKWNNDGIVGVYRFDGLGLQFINKIEKEGINA